jgi:hypothetical protein
VTRQLGTSRPPQDLAPSYSTLQRHLAPECYATYLFGPLTNVSFDHLDPLFTGLELAGQHVRPTETGVEFRTVLAYEDGYRNAARRIQRQMRVGGPLGEHRYGSPTVDRSNTTVVITEEVSSAIPDGPVAVEMR